MVLGLVRDLFTCASDNYRNDNKPQWALRSVDGESFALLGSREWSMEVRTKGRGSAVAMRAVLVWGACMWF